MNRRLQTPLLLQMEVSECGAAALGILLRHFGRHVALEQMRQACNVTRDGTTALDIIRAAKAYDMEASGLRRTTFTGLEKLTPPYIVHLRGGHFAVLDALDEHSVYLNDPAVGRRTLTRDEFMALYAGTAVVCTPNAAFVSERAPSRWRGIVREWLAGREFAVGAIVSVSLFLLIPGFLLPRLLQTFVDEVLTRRTDALQTVIIGLAAAFIMRVALLTLQGALLLRLETRLAVHAVETFLSRLLRMPLAFYAHRYSGDLAARLNIHDRIAGLLARDGSDALLNALLMVFYAGVMLTYSLPLTVITLVFVVINVGLLRTIAQRQRELGGQLAAQRAQHIGATISGLRALETLKAAGREAALAHQWRDFHVAVIDTEQRLNRLTQGYFALLPFSLAVNTALILVIGAHQVIDGALTLGALVALQSLVFNFIQPVNQLAALGGTLQTMESDLDRIDDILNYPARFNPPHADVTWMRLPKIGQVDVRDLIFGYNPNEPPLIDRVSFTLEPGSITMLRGASGRGKSTLARLIAGLIDAQSGTIYVSGRPAHTQSTEIGYADQVITLFAGTFRDNLTLWDDTISLDALTRAARDACIHETIMARGGYDAVITENGRDLSGGQRQCLEIARALARDPVVLILDETTNALDPATEAKVIRHLARRGCTVMLIAHRADTLRYAEHIIDLDALQPNRTLV
ncbi:MAG: cysteine peptidase family C39 domain-containing protein [Chloroflexota bacterium]|nr:cysteine peptidase family C39 domain-containing protein [Chloroflexota bacterium]